MKIKHFRFYIVEEKNASKFLELWYNKPTPRLPELPRVIPRNSTATILYLVY